VACIVQEAVFPVLEGVKSTPDSCPQELTKKPQIWATEKCDGCCGSVVSATAKGAHIG